jgi:integrase
LANPYVFVNPETGKLWHEIDLNLAWYATLRKAGIKGFRFHDMRHTFASRLVQAGVSMKTVAQLLGHSSVVVTERYSHLAPSKLENAVEVLTSAGRNEVLKYSRRKSES